MGARVPPAPPACYRPARHCPVPGCKVALSLGQAACTRHWTMAAPTLRMRARHAMRRLGPEHPDARRLVAEVLAVVAQMAWALERLDTCGLPKPSPATLDRLSATDEPALGVDRAVWLAGILLGGPPGLAVGPRQDGVGWLHARGLVEPVNGAVVRVVPTPTGLARFVACSTQAEGRQAIDHWPAVWAKRPGPGKGQRP